MRNLSHLRRTTVLVAAVSCALLVTAAAIAGTITASATVTGAGALGLSHTATATVPGVTLDGTDKSASYTIPLSITDARGTGAGWNGTITSTAFNNGTQSLATTASSITGVASACAGTTCTAPTNAITYGLTVPAAATAPAAVKFFNAAANTGMGLFTITPTISVSVPGNAYSGTYTSTVTVAVASGP